MTKQELRERMLMLNHNVATAYVLELIDQLDEPQATVQWITIQNTHIKVSEITQVGTPDAVFTAPDDEQRRLCMVIGGRQMDFLFDCQCAATEAYERVLAAIGAK